MFSLYNNAAGKSKRKLTSLCLSLLVAVGATQGPANCQTAPAFKPSQFKLKAPTGLRRPKTVSTVVPASYPDVLLVMPNSTADADETSQALKDAHGTIVESFGEGDMTTWVVKVEKGKFLETEKKLTNDKHFSAIQRDYVAHEQQVFGSPGPQPTAPNDPFYPSQWHMIAMDALWAWQHSTGKGATIAVADSGCASSNSDLMGKLYAGLDLVPPSKSQGIVDFDVHSHGTCVATTAAASSDNNILTASPAKDARIFPIRISVPDGNGHMGSDDKTIAKSIMDAGKHAVRIINISYGAGGGAGSFANALAHPIIHKWAKWYHDKKNGLAIFAAGNESTFDPNPIVPYMIFVSAVDENGQLTSFSNWGNPIWFTAPGKNIVCSERNGKSVTVNGTSFAAPLIASVAALILANHPTWSNTQVEQCMKLASAGHQNYLMTWNQYYGYGMPSALEAAQAQ